MKRIPLFVLSVVLLVQPTAHAAISTKTINSVTPTSSIEGLLLSGTTTITYSNQKKVTSDVVVVAQDINGAQLWARTIDSGKDELATAGTVDGQGNIWLTGVIATVLPAETSTPTTGIDNPDSVVVDAPTINHRDLSTLVVWKLSPAGVVTNTFEQPLAYVPLVTGISVNTSGASIIAMINGRSSLIQMTPQGVFSKTVSLGTEKTSFNEVVRTLDGSSYIYGASSEALQGKKVAGIRDGILLTINKSGTVTQLVRSSAIKGNREWQSATSGFVTTGSVVTGKVTETAITQFTKSFAPTWTARYASTGQSRVVTGGGLTYLAFTSRSAITGVSGWKPSSPSLLILAFDGKGNIKASYAIPALIAPISLQYTRELGVVGLATGAGDTVSIFRLTSR